MGEPAGGGSRTVNGVTNGLGYRTAQRELGAAVANNEITQAQANQIGATYAQRGFSRREGDTMADVRGFLTDQVDAARRRRRGGGGTRVTGTRRTR